MRSCCILAVVLAALGLAGARPRSPVLHAPSGGDALASCVMPNMRPPASQRLYVSPAVEGIIEQFAPQFIDPNLATLFANTLPNTLDTTVASFSAALDADGLTTGAEDAFIITGDIAAMWLRDSTRQVLPYMQFATNDSSIAALVRGVINRHTLYLTADPHANAFNFDASTPSPHADDSTSKPAFAGTTVSGMGPYIFERKFEIDSLAHTMLLATSYYSATKDTSPFTAAWANALSGALDVLQANQAATIDDLNPAYNFQRSSTEPTDTLSHGIGWPAAHTGMVKSAFRPSDDATTLPFNIPGNAFLSVQLSAVATLASALGYSDIAATASSLASDISTGIQTYGIMQHPTAGRIYAYEVDGFGSAYFMDDANIPSLLSLPLLGWCSATDPLYLATRAAVWSTANPYYAAGNAAPAVGGPHNGVGWVWPLSLMVKAMTAVNESEVSTTLAALVQSSACSGLMHESYWKDDFGSYTRAWFAWANSFFGGLILHIASEFPSIIFK